MASRQSQQLVDLYKGWTAALTANPDMPLDDTRAMLEHWCDVTAEPGGLDYIETDAGGVPALWAAPKGCARDRALLCSHGDGYVVGSMFSHRKMYGHIVKAVGCRALITDAHRRTSIPDLSTTWSRRIAGCGTRKSHRVGSRSLATSRADAWRSQRSFGRANAACHYRQPRCRCPLKSTCTGSGERGKATGNATCWSSELSLGLVAIFLGEGGDRRDPFASPTHGDLRGLPRGLHPGGRS